MSTDAVPQPEAVEPEAVEPTTEAAPIAEQPPEPQLTPEEWLAQHRRQFGRPDGPPAAAGSEDAHQAHQAQPDAQEDAQSVERPAAPVRPRFAPDGAPTMREEIAQRMSTYWRRGKK